MANYTDTFSEETRAEYGDSPLWKPWMADIRLRQCRSLEDLDDFIRRGGPHPELCWDIETKSLFPDPSEIVGHSIAFTPDEAMYVPVRHVPDSEQNLDPDLVFDMILKAIEPPKILTVFNYRFEGAFLKTAGVNRSTSFDVMHDGILIRWLYNSDDKRINLKLSAKVIVGHDMLTIREVPGCARDRLKKGKIDFSYTRPSEAVFYAAADVIMTLLVEEKTLPKVIETGQEMICELEHRLVGVLTNMEQNKVRIDRSVLIQGKKDLMRWAEVVASELYEANGGIPFNPLSPQGAATFLKKQGVLLPLTEKGATSTDAKVLSLLSTDFPIVKRISIYRSLLKEVGTYCEPLLAHTSEEVPWGTFNFVQISGTTGRFGSKKGEVGDPRFLPLNAQSIPAADAYEKMACRRILNPPLADLKEALFYGRQNGELKYEPAQKKKEKEEEIPRGPNVSQDILEKLDVL